MHQVWLPIFTLVRISLWNDTFPLLRKRAIQSCTSIKQKLMHSQKTEKVQLKWQKWVPIEYFISIIAILCLTFFHIYISNENELEDHIFFPLILTSRVLLWHLFVAGYYSECWLYQPEAWSPGHLDLQGLWRPHQWWDRKQGQRLGPGRVRIVRRLAEHLLGTSAAPEDHQSPENKVFIKINDRLFTSGQKEMWEQKDICSRWQRFAVYRNVEALHFLLPSRPETPPSVTLRD